MASAMKAVLRIALAVAVPGCSTAASITAAEPIDASGPKAGADASVYPDGPCATGLSPADPGETGPTDAGSCPPFDAPGDSAPARAVAGVNPEPGAGALTIGGHVRDPSGGLVVGARIELSGDAPQVRYSDFTGGYRFRIGSGSYGLTVRGPCAAPIADATLGTVSSDVAHDFTVTCPDCITATVSNAISTG